MHARRVVVFGCLIGLALSAGCASLLGTGGPQESETVTGVPVPEPGKTQPAGTAETPTETRTVEQPPDGSDEAPVVAAVGSGPQPRYRSLRPTCERPPGLVIHIQVMALANDGPDEQGINATYQFSNPTPPDGDGPSPVFVRNIRTNYAPLLNAERVSYGPLQRDGITASRNVTVVTPQRTASYEWILLRRSGGAYEGCWITSRVERT
ncbi:MAG: DUF4864 domain-containing protein [Salinirussus sp.]